MYYYLPPFYIRTVLKQNLLTAILLSATFLIIFIYCDHNNKPVTKVDNPSATTTIILTNAIKDEDTENISNTTTPSPYKQPEVFSGHNKIALHETITDIGVDSKQESYSDRRKHTYKIYPKIIINPPLFISAQNKKKVYYLKTKMTLADDPQEKEALKLGLSSLLSNIVQKQLNSLQSPKNCSGINIICGHNDECGLGCQIHHRVACLMVSFALGFPLVHDENKWPYNDKWTDTFFPLGSRCKAGKKTYRLEWRSLSYPVIYKNNAKGANILLYGSDMEKYDEQIQYPLDHGIPVSQPMADLVEIIHPKPFIWWVGQFMKFALRLNPKMRKRIQNAKAEINFTHPVVGLHVRLTDKVDGITKLMRPVIPIKDYMNEAKHYFNNSTNEKSQQKNIFVASDDVNVIKIISKKYPNWNTIGFRSRKTLATQLLRVDALHEIVVDFFLLLDSDLIVCAFSSNICRLLYEMKNGVLHSGDEKNRLHSLRGNYSYLLKGHQIEKKILKIRSNYYYRRL